MENEIKFSNHGPCRQSQAGTEVQTNQYGPLVLTTCEGCNSLYASTKGPDGQMNGHLNVHSIRYDDSVLADRLIKAWLDAGLPKPRYY